MEQIRARDGVWYDSELLLPGSNQGAEVKMCCQRSQQREPTVLGNRYRVSVWQERVYLLYLPAHSRDPPVGLEWGESVSVLAIRSRSQA